MEEIFNPCNLSYYGDTFIEYSGEGILALSDDSELKCEFIAGQYMNGNIVLICRILPIEIHRLNIQTWKTGFIKAKSLRGITKDGKLITASEVNYAIGRGISDDLTAVYVIFNPYSLQVDVQKDIAVNGISFGITNFAFKGAPFTHPDFTEFLDLDLMGKKVAIWKPKFYNEIINYMKLTEEARITCEIWAEISGVQEVGAMEKMITDLCYVLSVASGSKVQWVFRDIHSDNTRVSTMHRLVPDKPYNPQSIIDSNMDPRALEAFVNIAYSSYLSDIDLFGMVNNVPRITASIDALIDARSKADFIQVRGIKFVTTMEIIKEMFQVWMPKKKLLPKGKFKKFEAELRDAILPIFSRYSLVEEGKEAVESLFELNRPSFRSILVNGLKNIEFNILERELDLFVRSRNSLVHQGRFYCETATEDQKTACSPLGNIGEEYIFISDFLNRIFLTLFKYKSGWNNLGNTYLYMSRFEDAKKAYNEAIKFDQESAIPWFGLANTYRYLDQYLEAIKAFKQAIELSKKSGPKLITLFALNGLGPLLWIQGDQEGAIKANMEAVELDPDFCPAHISLAASYQKLNQKDKLDVEIGIIDKLISKEGDYNHACFEAIRGNADAALSYLKIALEQGQQHIDWVRKDPDLEILRESPGFEALIGEISAKRKAIADETVEVTEP